jgi:hypothetical protein
MVGSTGSSSGVEGTTGETVTMDTRLLWVLGTTVATARYTGKSTESPTVSVMDPTEPVSTGQHSTDRAIRLTALGLRQTTAALRPTAPALRVTTLGLRHSTTALRPTAPALRVTTLGLRHSTTALNLMKRALQDFTQPAHQESPVTQAALSLRRIAPLRSFNQHTMLHITVQVPGLKFPPKPPTPPQPLR